MAQRNSSTSVHPVGIDLGTTYSCISHLTPKGQPITLPNSEGELATPSIVLFEGDEVVVGTEALRNAVSHPERVVVHAKRHMGDPHKFWAFDGHLYRPTDISAFILRKLLDGAEERLGRIRHAVITVPAQFSDVQRQQTVEAGMQAGLERVDIINEPVAAAMCYVLGEGMWFAELANDQTVMVFDLGGGTFDLSLVRYNRDAVKVIASGGDLRLGGLDWNRALEEFACDEFIKGSISDPRLDKESMQALAIEVEQVKRSLSVRPKSSLVVQHDGRRKTFAIDRDQFELLTGPLLRRTEDLTRGMLKVHGLGWANVDALLVTGGASRMPMIRDMLQRISGTTLNTTLSPDQSICHGAAYYAGMLLSGQRVDQSTSSLNRQATARLSRFKQQSVSGRGLGILVRDPQTGQRLPHYLIKANTPLPCAFRQRFGTFTPNQKQVKLHIVESGQSTDDPHVELGMCVIEELPEKLPQGAPIEVTIRYDEQGRVHVEAIDLTSGTGAKTSIIRQPPGESGPADDEPASSALMDVEPPRIPTTPIASRQPIRPTRTGSTASRPAASRPHPAKRPAPISPASASGAQLEEADRPIPLCNRCGEVLDAKGRCPACPATRAKGPATGAKRRPVQRPISPEEETELMVHPPASRQKNKPQLRRPGQSES